MQLEIPTSEPSGSEALTDTVAQTDGNKSSLQLEFSSVLREKVAVSGWVLVGTVFSGLFFLYCSYLPVYHTDIWGHVSYGQIMLEQERLLVEDPYVDLAAGVEMINNAWLSQILFGWLTNQAGAQGLSDGYAVACLALFLTTLAAFSIRSNHWGIGFLCAVGMWTMITFRLAIVRPELLGSFCFALLLLQFALIDRQRNNSNRESALLPIWAWGTIPLTFVLWTNLHGSFIVGFAVLGASVLGAGIAAMRKHRSIRGVWSDRALRSEVAILQISLLAACLNPYGIDLLLQTVLFPAHPNLKSVLEWYPLEIVSLEGIPMAISWVAAAFVIRHSRVRFSVRDVVLLLILTLAVCLRVRMIAWYAPVYFFVMSPHIADIWRRVTDLRLVKALGTAFSFMSRPSFHAALIAGFACYLTFAFSPVSRHVMGGTVRNEEKILSHQTPFGVTNYFKEHSQQGLIYAPQWWGDWINWKLDGEVEVFVSTNTIHLVPTRVWQDYLSISRGRSGFSRLLNNYRMNTMVVSKDLQPGLIKIMDSTTGWTVAFDDEISRIYSRSALASADAAIRTDP